MFDVPASAETVPFTAWTPHRSADSPPPAAANPTPGLPASSARRPEALAAEITTLAGHLNAAQYRFLKLLDEFDRAQGWAGPGVRSLAHWLELKCGLGDLAAREKVRVARALRELPLIDAAFERGKVSYSKVRAMTRAATPENEKQLLNIARHGTAAHLERLVRVYRRCREQTGAAPGETAIRREERFYCFAEDDETMVFGGRVSVEQGRLLVKALDAMVAEMETDEREGGDAQTADDAPQADESGKAEEPEKADGSGKAKMPEKADGSGKARRPEKADGSGKARKPEKADGGAPNAATETAENVSAETYATGFGAGVSSDTSAAASRRNVSAETSARASEQSVSAETTAGASEQSFSAETTTAASEPDVSAETCARASEPGVSAETLPDAGPDRTPLKPLRVRRATALAQIAEHYLATRRGGSGATPMKSSDAYQVFVHVNANDAHPDNRINGAHTTYTDDRRSLAPHVARQLACDASRRTVLENERGEVLNIGRRSRIVPWHIAHALRIRDGGCRFPGCNQHRWTDAHHIHHWADGGETSLENLVILCRYHHRALHRDEFRIEHGADGGLIFMDARHRPAPLAIHPQFGDQHGAGGSAGVADTADTVGCLLRKNGVTI